MTFEEYQQEAVKFRTDSANNEEYLTLGLIEEVGEAAGKLAKQFGEPRHLVAYDDTLDNFERYKFVRPLSSCVRPKIGGDVYTWEMEVAE